MSGSIGATSVEFEFATLKRALHGTCFHSSDEVKEAEQDFLKNQVRFFYSKGTGLQLKQWDLCYNTYGDSFDFQKNIIGKCKIRTNKEIFIQLVQFLFGKPLCKVYYIKKGITVISGL